MVKSASKIEREWQRESGREETDKWKREQSERKSGWGKRREEERERRKTRIVSAEKKVSERERRQEKRDGERETGI